MKGPNAITMSIGNLHRESLLFTTYSDVKEKYWREVLLEITCSPCNKVIFHVAKLM